MDANAPADIRELYDALAASEPEAEDLARGLSEEQGTRRLEAGAWSIAECLDHLATGNEVYLQPMLEPAARAREQGKVRRRPANPGLLGGLFVKQIEPPPKWWSKLKAPPKIQPHPSPPLGESLQRFLTSHAEVRAFLETNHDLDLAGIGFPNPFIPGLRWSLATGLYVLSAHARRHLLQAWGVRKAIERARRP